MHFVMQKLESKIMPEIEIQNTVCTADLNQKIDIGSFNEYDHLSSNLDLYACGYVKDDSMVGKVTVFGNGKLISVGTKSPEQAKKELKKASKLLQKYKLSKPAKIISKVRNIVSRFDLERKLPIEQLARTLPRSMYEPEQFPGLIFRIPHGCVALIFSSGKGILVGAKTIEEINSSFFELKQYLKILS